jgi:hypothetical protein
VRVATALGAGGRRQRTHALDPKRHLGRGLSNDNFAIRSRVPGNSTSSASPISFMA